MISIKLLDSMKTISSKINISLSDLVNQQLKSKKGQVESGCRSLASEWISSCPEMVDLAAGVLSGPFGLYKGSESVAVGAISNAVKSSVFARVQTVSKDFTKGGIFIYFQPSNFANLISLPQGHVDYDGGDLHWLKWMLEFGDRIIVKNYSYKPNSGIGRSGMGSMTNSGSFRVPPGYSGTVDDNFITRALSGKEQESQLNLLLESILK
jgi:hypothetical protein